MRLAHAIMLILLLPIIFAAPCTSTFTLHIQNTQPNGYLYIRANESSVNLTIMPSRVYTRHGETATFTINITSQTQRNGVLILTAYVSGVPLKTLHLPYTLACSHAQEPAPQNAQTSSASGNYTADIILFLYTIIFTLLIISLAAWWKKRWIRAERMRILHIRRRKPISPAWIVILTILIITSIILLLIILTLTLPWQSLSSIF